MLRAKSKIGQSSEIFWKNTNFLQFLLLRTKVIFQLFLGNPNYDQLHFAQSVVYKFKLFNIEGYNIFFLILYINTLTTIFLYVFCIKYYRQLAFCMGVSDVCPILTFYRSIYIYIYLVPTIRLLWYLVIPFSPCIFARVFFSGTFPF